MTAPCLFWRAAAMRGNRHGIRPWQSLSLMDVEIAFHDDIMRDDLEKDQELEKIWDQWEQAHSRQTLSLYPNVAASHLTHTFICPHPSSLFPSSLPSSFPSSFPPLSLPLSLSPLPSGLPPKPTLELQSLCELLSVELVFATRFTNVLSVFVYMRPKKAGITSTLKIKEKSLVSGSRRYMSSHS